MLRWILRGAAAGAAGATALNAATYLDMLLRGRGASSTPNQVIEMVAAKADVSIPGSAEEHQNRVSGAGALMGLLTGTGTGAALGVLRRLGLRGPLPLVALVATLGAMAGSNGPMTALGITDPRQWSATDWLSDVLPHVAYGVVTATTLRATE